MKTINNIPVTDLIFEKMVLLWERLRRIEAESKILLIQKNETESKIKLLVDLVEESRVIVPLDLPSV